MRPLPVVTDLPDELLLAIGHVVVEFSYLEGLLANTIYDLLGVDQPVGRLAIGSPRAVDMLERIFDIADHKGLRFGGGRELDSGQLRRDLMKHTREYGLLRDHLAHGLFQRDEDGTLYIQNTRGKWQPPGQKQAVKRKVNPSGELIDAETVIGLAESIHDVSMAVAAMRRELTGEPVAAA